MATLRTTATACAAAAALGGSFAAGLAIAAPGPPPDDRDRRTVADGPGHEAPVAHANDALRAPSSCPDLLEWYVERGVDRVTAFGWGHPVYYAQGVDGAVVVNPLDSSGGGELAVEQRSTAPTADRVTSSATGTNVQEAAVDEPDVVKTDGEVLVRVQDGDLVTYDVSGDEPARLSSLELGDDDAELLLVDDRIVVLTDHERERSRVTRTLVVDLSSPDDPTVVDEATYGAGLVTARLHGDTVRLVVDSGLPDLDFAEPSVLRSERSALEHNREVVRDSELTDWLPTVAHDDGDAEQLLSCDQVALPSEDAGLGTLTVVGLDPADPGTWSASAVATSSQTTYFSDDAMYLATAPAPVRGCCWDGEEPAPGVPEELDGSTAIHQFALAGSGATYVASGEVDGAIRDRWAMDEADGVLRVAVGPTQRTGNFNSVVTLARAGPDLVEEGRVDKLGVDETIRSVRWFDDLAFVVTFRQVDPLYAVDLTDPREPELLGQLKIPGYSEYLHPLGAHRLLGIGQDATLSGRVRGARAALFNVTDLTRPRALDAVDYRAGSTAGAALDARQFTWLPERRTALTVISSGPGGSGGRTGWVSVLTLDGGPIENRMVEVEYGVEVDDVRTVPLPDGRVVLITGETVSKFEL